MRKRKKKGNKISIKEPQKRKKKTLRDIDNPHKKKLIGGNKRITLTVPSGDNMAR